MIDRCFWCSKEIVEDGEDYVDADGQILCPSFINWGKLHQTLIEVLEEV